MIGSYSDYTRRLERLLEVCRNLSANLENKPLLRTLVAAAEELTGSEFCYILIFDPQNGALRYVAAPEQRLAVLKGKNVPLDGSAAGWAISHEQPLVLNRAAAEIRMYRPADPEQAAGAHSLMSVPMIFSGKPMGVIEVLNKQDHTDYTEEDSLILITLASQAAMSIQNRRLLEESRNSYRQVMELNRMKSDFIAIASHELRTSLGLILGHASFLAETAPADLRSDLDVIVRSAIRLKEIVEQLSSLTHLEHGAALLNRVNINLNDLSREVVSSFRETADARKIRLGVETDGQVVWVQGDADKLVIVLKNLIKNALAFTNEGGQVRVCLDQVSGFAKVSVIDNGIGIPPAEQQKIFQRFYQVENHLTRKYGGMGLGLSIARDLVEIHGGKIWVESQENKGSNFTFLLPKEV